MKYKYIFQKNQEMGKSTKILKDFESYIKNNYIYTYFPIWDNITRGEILTRLKELKMNVLLFILTY